MKQVQPTLFQDNLRPIRILDSYSRKIQAPIGVRDIQESPSINHITQAKEDSRCRKLGSKISLANSIILAIKI